MFNTYSRVYNDEPDEDVAAVTRLIRETAGGQPASVVPDVVVSSGAARSRTQQGIQQRRGGTRAEPTATPSTSVNTSTAITADLIDLGDTSAPRPRAVSAARGKSEKQRWRGQPSQPQSQVELVTLNAPLDPFDLLFQQQPQPQPTTATTADLFQTHRNGGGGGGRDSGGGADGPRTSTAPAASDGRQHPLQSPPPQHPLDLLFGPEPPTAAASRSAASFPSLGSFSDLLRPLAGSMGAATTSGASAIGETHERQTGGGPGGQQHYQYQQQQHHQQHQMQYGSYGQPPYGAVGLQRHGHSASTSGIDDLLTQQRWSREEAAGAVGVGPGGREGWLGGTYQAPAVLHTDRGSGSIPAGMAASFDPFFPSPSPSAATSATSNRTNPAAATDAGQAASAANGLDAGGGTGGGEGFSMDVRELLLYGIPLLKDKLVFLPVANWKDVEDTSTVLGKVSSGVSQVQQSISTMWHSLKDKNQFSAKIYKAGQAILENMNAEERLMRNIPKKANKLVVLHPSTVPPDEIQDQLTALTSNFCVKSAGKAAVAGVMLPVAVGLEILAIPGIGMYTAYQLFKSTSAAAGGSRLNTYLRSEKSEVRVCYVPTPKMDLYQLKARLSPDGCLGGEDIEDLVHDLQQPQLLHPLTELRNRHLKKTQTTKADYALLPMSAPDVDEQYGNVTTKKVD